MIQKLIPARTVVLQLNAGLKTDVNAYKTIHGGTKIAESAHNPQPQPQTSQPVPAAPKPKPTTPKPTNAYNAVPQTPKSPRTNAHANPATCKKQ